MQGGNAARSGHARGNTAQTTLTGTLKWSVTTPGGDAGTQSSIAVSHNAGGTQLFLGTNSGSVFAVDASDGRTLWKFTTSAQITASPALGLDDTLFVGCTNSHMYALDVQTGAEKWDVDVGGAISTALLVDAHGNVVFSTDAGFVYSLAGASGKINWWYLAAAQTPSSISLALSDPGMLFASVDSSIVALNVSSGTYAWTAGLDGNASPPSVSSTGTVVVGTDAGTVWGLHADSGVVLWGSSTRGIVTASPAISSAGVAFAADTQGFVYAWSLDMGALQWDLAFASTVYFSAVSPVLTADQSTVVFTSSDAGVFAFDASTGASVWSLNLPCASMQGTPSFDPSGVMYMACTELYAFDAVTSPNPSSSSTPAPTHTTTPIPSPAAPVPFLAWLTQRGNDMRTGQAVGEKITQTSGKWLWSTEFTTGVSADVDLSPLVDTHGNVYVGRLDGTIDFHCNPKVVDCKGWSASQPGPVSASMAMTTASGGILFAAVSSATLVALSAATGNVVWTRTGSIKTPVALLAPSEALSGNTAAPTLGHNGQVYLSALHAVFAWEAATGKELWVYRDDTFTYSSVAVGADGTLFVCANATVAGTRSSVRALNGGTGALLWTMQHPGADSYDVPVVGFGNTLYIVASSANTAASFILVVDGTSGALIRTLSEPGVPAPHSALAVGIEASPPQQWQSAPQNVLYFVSDREVVAVTGTGEVKWRTPLPVVNLPQYAAPSLGTDGTVYVSAPFHTGGYAAVFALSGADGAIKWSSRNESPDFVPCQSLLTSPSIGGDGSVVWLTQNRLNTLVQVLSFGAEVVPHPSASTTPSPSSTASPSSTSTPSSTSSSTSSQSASASSTASFSATASATPSASASASFSATASATPSASASTIASDPADGSPGTSQVVIIASSVGGGVLALLLAAASIVCCIARTKSRRAAAATGPTAGASGAVSTAGGVVTVGNGSTVVVSAAADGGGLSVNNGSSMLLTASSMSHATGAAHPQMWFQPGHASPVPLNQYGYRNGNSDLGDPLLPGSPIRPSQQPASASTPYGYIL